MIVKCTVQTFGPRGALLERATEMGAHGVVKVSGGFTFTASFNAACEILADLKYAHPLRFWSGWTEPV
jgi:hypothetical protein